MSKEFKENNKKILGSKVKVKSTNDNRKTVRVPKKIYNELTSHTVHSTKAQLISEVLTSFTNEYEQNKELLKDFGELDTIPIKISNDDFKILKIIKFETDDTYTNIIASAISYYLD
ncbi:uncharacterized protein CBO05P1_213 [Clostridium botulinum B str. Osaka05]|uniref:Uncharacterized protein n=1 Tax=Clostridium botulinum B str. Osaka05 TaxID=1407017 RepID=A0A060N503_CLOBO|nr:hypothetical protein [Clostridium botulinum]BAO04932.1 uncharacterized protein CBO05P1_213 [Clostridium botulinum B str. Osaka05]